MCDEYIRCKMWFSVCDEDVGCDLIDVIYGVYCVICLMGYYNAFYDLKRFFISWGGLMLSSIGAYGAGGGAFHTLVFAVAT